MQARDSVPTTGLRATSGQVYGLGHCSTADELSADPRFDNCGFSGLLVAQENPLLRVFEGFAMSPLKQGRFFIESERVWHRTERSGSRL